MKRKKKKKKHRIEYVKWLDHSGSSMTGWRTKESMLEETVLPCETVGFLVGEDKTTITLANSAYCEHERYALEMSIVKSAIIERRKFR